uniref:Uncharacterized protein n=1 Tax=Chromera velia CCMP2878 TaxID=1169474 RepID=A0A0G4F3V8_9ALVE|eukprot:Cvel_15023.t1-p1 / transcript=Cvel_15023.t1 / gene=Cvel_15023 / organism=Chromera_velia_CCMP2878 / gene_product=hypothetical protein / transcript_product=hypothetical protein / location=Cvel_scaffold1093:35171-36172(-) / protein_length=132 / sequence_SO=supercontig / SO=protein_coding / is_pseudo=false
METGSAWRQPIFGDRLVHVRSNGALHATQLCTQRHSLYGRSSSSIGASSETGAGQGSAFLTSVPETSIRFGASRPVSICLQDLPRAAPRFALRASRRIVCHKLQETVHTRPRTTLSTCNSSSKSAPAFTSAP